MWPPQKREHLEKTDHQRKWYGWDIFFNFTYIREFITTIVEEGDRRSNYSYRETPLKKHVSSLHKNKHAGERIPSTISTFNKIFVLRFLKKAGVTRFSE